jgi:hypothetical protein
MATVRMSRRLLSEIRQKARDKFTLVNPTKEYPEPDTYYDQNIAPKVNKAMEDFNATMDGLATLNTKNVECIVFKSTDPEETDRYARTKSYTCHFSVTRDVPECITGSYYSSEAIVRLDINDPFIKKLETIREYNDKLGDEERAYVNKVDETCNQFSTLNQALTAWPALEALVPHDKIQKVHEKVSRKAKQQKQRELIVEQEQELNEVLLTSKLLESD